MAEPLTPTSDLRKPIKVIEREVRELKLDVAGAVPATSPTFSVSVLGDTSMEVFNTLSTTISAFGAATTMTIGGTPTTAITHNYSTNSTANATTKTVNVATGGAAGSTTNVNVGSANGGTTTVNSPILAATGVTATTLNVGGSSTVSKIITATATWDVPSLGGGLGAGTTITVAGVAAGDTLIPSLSSITQYGWMWDAWVSATDTVSVRLTNFTGGTINLASGTLRVTCIKF